MKGKYLRKAVGVVLATLTLVGTLLISTGTAEAQGRRRRVIIIRRPHIYRPFAYRHWWNYPYGYDPWSPLGNYYSHYVFDNSEKAEKQGYKDGVKTGKSDGKKDKSYDPERSHYFREAGFGNFAEVYRSAFVSGYEDGYRAGRAERAS